ncbi:MAG: YihY/virulence factor BrkB family protein [Syntrophaceae bacterium]|nr:YihY/virulence factor BrkB family protein [Syntrophaceae bacterium]
MGLKREILNKFLFFWGALKKFDSDHGFFLSAGITFNLLICLVPLILLLLAIVGNYLYSDRQVLNHIRHYLESVAPSLDPRIMRNILKVIQGRKIVGVLGIGGLIWSSTWVFSSLRTALNMVFQVEKGRGILRAKAVDLLMIFLAGLFHIASMTLTSAFTVVRKYRFSAGVDPNPVLQWMLKYVVPFFFTFGMFFLIYKIVPDRKIRLKSAFQAALFTSLLWEVAKQLFGWYVLHLGRFSAVYGSLGTLAIFFLWVYYSSAILLLGGEVAFFLERDEDQVHG